MDEPDEVHAWFIGVCQTVQRARPYKFSELVNEDEFPADVMASLKKEYTYYYVAFWLPRVILLAIILSQTPEIWLDEACRILVEKLHALVGS